MKDVSTFLGNTPALARSSYVDPRVVEAYEQGRTIAPAVQVDYPTRDERQAGWEREVLRLLGG
jgi:DNA topoisomerase IB